MRACTEVGWGEWAPPASARTLSAAPDPPTGVVISSSPRLQSRAVPDSEGRLALGEHAGAVEAERVDGACGGWGGSEDVAGGCGDS